MNWDKINLLRRFWRTSILKSIFLNFATLPFSQALKLPIIVTKQTYFYSLSGRIQLTSRAKFGMIRIGYQGEDVVVPKSERALLQIEGSLIMGRNIKIGCGTIIRVEPKATLRVEDDVRIGAKCRIVAYDKITIGQNTGISWECQLMDSNMHDMIDVTTGKLARFSSPIDIGANNWIGTRCSIMKGCVTPEYTIIAASSFCDRKYDINKYSVIAGSPAKLVKSNLKRADFK